MLVYAELFRERNGAYPVKAVLYFLGELDAAQTTLTRPAAAILEVPMDPQRIQVALQNFNGTVAAIQQSKATDTWPAPPLGQQPDQATCDICDIRWSCPTMGANYPMRYP